MEDDDIWIEDHTVIVGSIAWYDYSGRWKQDHRSLLQIEASKKLYNNDGNYIHWNRSDLSFAKDCLQRFTKRLEILEQDEKVSRIIVVTHVPLFEETIVYPFPGPGNAYFYNLTFGDYVLDHAHKVTDVISGHTHLGVDCYVQGIHRTIHCQVCGSDYGFPAIVVI